MRDAAEAQRHRIEALERELEDARRETESLRGRASRADIAEAKLERAQRDIEALRREVAPARSRRGRAVALAIGTVAAVATVAWVVVSVRESDAQARAEAARWNAQAEQDPLRGSHARELESLQAQLAAAQQRATQAEQRAASTAAELERARRLEERTQAQRAFVALELTSRRIRVAGRTDLGRECTVAISPSGGECRARITCGGTEIYPAPGRGGYFSCESRDGHLIEGRDVNGTPASGDPMLHVDGTRGVITVSDGPAPAWSVRITTPPL